MSNAAATFTGSGAPIAPAQVRNYQEEVISMKPQLNVYRSCFSRAARSWRVYSNVSARLVIRCRIHIVNKTLRT